MVDRVFVTIHSHDGISEEKSFEFKKDHLPIYVSGDKLKKLLFLKGVNVENAPGLFSTDRGLVRCKTKKDFDLIASMVKLVGDPVVEITYDHQMFAEAFKELNKKKGKKS